MIGTYYRLSLADEDVGADKAESNSIQGQRGLVEGYIMAPTSTSKDHPVHVELHFCLELHQSWDFLRLGRIPSHH